MTGVDLADRAISAASKLLAKHGLDEELIVADASAWEPTQEYDLITTSFALPEGSERSSVLRMIRDALAPGGTVIVKEFDSTMSQHVHFAGFDLVTLEELCAAFAGFEIARAEIVDTPVHEHARGVVGAGEEWTAAFLHARRPRADPMAH